ncbi:MAG: tetratricopeptide repeat protein [Sandaracinaceae bacterium]
MPMATAMDRGTQEGPTLLMVGQGEAMDLALTEALTRRGLSVQQISLPAVTGALRTMRPRAILLLGDAAREGGRPGLERLGRSPGAAELPVLLLADGPGAQRPQAGRRPIALIPRSASADQVARRVVDLASGAPGRLEDRPTFGELVERIAGELRGPTTEGGSDASAGAPRPTRVEAAVREFVAKVRPHVTWPESGAEGPGGPDPLDELRDPGPGAGVLRHLRLLLIDGDPGRADALAQELRAQGALVVVSDGAGGARERAADLDPQLALLVAEGSQAQSPPVLQALRRHLRLRWASTLVVAPHEVAPSTRPAPATDVLVQRVQPFLAPEDDLRARAARGEPFEVPLERTGPGRLLRVLVEVGTQGRVQANCPHARVVVDLAEGLVVGATARLPAPKARMLEGSRALACFLALSAARVRVEPRPHPATANIMVPVEEALANASTERAPDDADAGPHRPAGPAPADRERFVRADEAGDEETATRDPRAMAASLEASRIDVEVERPSERPSRGPAPPTEDPRARASGSPESIARGPATGPVSGTRLAAAARTAVMGSAGAPGAAAELPREDDTVEWARASDRDPAESYGPQPGRPDGVVLGGAGDGMAPPAVEPHAPTVPQAAAVRVGPGGEVRRASAAAPPGPRAEAPGGAARRAASSAPPGRRAPPPVGGGRASSSTPAPGPQPGLPGSPAPGGAPSSRPRPRTLGTPAPVDDVIAAPNAAFLLERDPEPRRRRQPLEQPPVPLRPTPTGQTAARPRDDDDPEPPPDLASLRPRAPVRALGLGSLMVSVAVLAAVVGLIGYRYSGLRVGALEEVLGWLGAGGPVAGAVVAAPLRGRATGPTAASGPEPAKADGPRAAADLPAAAARPEQPERTWAAPPEGGGATDEPQPPTSAEVGPPGPDPSAPATPPELDDPLPPQLPGPAEDAAPEDGDDIEGMLTRARRAGQTRTAERIYREILDREPTEHHAAVGLARLLMARGVYREAVDLLQVAVQRRRTRAAYRVLLGDALAGSGDIEGARQQYETALEIDPEDARAQRRLER